MRFGKKVLSIVLCVIMVFGTVGYSGFTELHELLSIKASAEKKYSTGDIIIFGSYPQSLVKDNTLKTKLNAQSGNWISYGYYCADNAIGSGY